MGSQWASVVEWSEIADMIIDTTEEVVMDADVTTVFMRKIEILFILLICIFVMLCLLLVFGVFMLSHLFLQKREKIHQVAEVMNNGVLMNILTLSIVNYVTNNPTRTPKQCSI